MAFSSEQVAFLKAKLNPENVASRDQAGRKLSYVEGWHVIAEANRIFGFDAWDRELVAIKLLGEPREVDKKARVGYMATVRIKVRAGDGIIIREGTGFGSGIDKDVDQAHESALKEAETDAMKRALMTFGNPFGLALYDKTQSSVGFEEKEVELDFYGKPVVHDGHYTAKRRPRGQGPRLSDAGDINTIMDALKANVAGKASSDALREWVSLQWNQIKSLPDKAYDELMDAIDAERDRFAQGEAA